MLCFVLFFCLFFFFSVLFLFLDVFLLYFSIKAKHNVFGLWIFYLPCYFFDVIIGIWYLRLLSCLYCFPEYLLLTFYF